MAQSECSKVTKTTIQSTDEEEEFGPQLITRLEVFVAVFYTRCPFVWN